MVKGEDDGEVVGGGSSVGAGCRGDCEAPLLCRQGRCECWQGRVINGTCVVGSPPFEPPSLVSVSLLPECPDGLVLVGQSCVKRVGLGEGCEADGDCAPANAHCFAGTCACLPGTVSSGDGCLASRPHSPSLCQSLEGRVYRLPGRKPAGGLLSQRGSRR